MKVVVWGINYAPEVTGIAPCNVALCEFLARGGWEVRMVTAFAYYPQWRKAEGDRGRLFRTEVVNGVRVHRCWHFVPGRPRAWSRMAHEASFVAVSFVRLLFLPRAEVYFVVSPPLALGVAAWALTRLKGSRYIFHVQDLQPDGAVETGLLKEGFFTRLLGAAERFAYRGAAVVGGISEGMRESFRSKGVPEGKIALLPNGARLPVAGSAPERGFFRERHGIGAGAFVVSYAGNLGRKQGLEILPEAAARAGEVQFVLCGDGAERAGLEGRVAELGLGNFLLLPLLPEELYHGLLVDSDVCVIPQMGGAGRAFFPSKLLMALAFGRPVVTVADEGSELARTVAEGGCGVNCLPGDAEGLAAALVVLRADVAGRARMGAAARAMAEGLDWERTLGKGEGNYE